MYYNALGNAERIGMAISDDMVSWKRFGSDPVLEHGNRGITGDAHVQRMGKLWVMSHKPCMVKWKGTVYHFYCAVDKDNNRGIALATSKEL